MPNVYIIAGPNGSGKTTFAREFLPRYVQCPHFINADLIAEGLSPFSPQQASIKAGRLVLEQIKEFANKNADFAFENTLSGRAYIRYFKKLKASGYHLHLFFLWIPDSSLAVARIKNRVTEGGHHVPIQDVQRRFHRSLSNFFKIYKPLLNSWMIFDNAADQPKLIAKEKNGRILILNKDLFSKIIQKI